MTTGRAEQPDEAKARQLYERLRRLIEEGEWPHDHSVPSQNELVDEYGMSVRTVRDAVIWLAEIGRVRKSHGKRTRVYMPAESPHRIVLDQRDPRVSELARVAEGPVAEGPVVAFLPAAGRGPVTTSWREDTYSVPEWDERRLGIEAGTKLLRRTLIVAVDGLPVVSSATLVPAEFVRGTVGWRDAPVGEHALTGVTVTFSRATLHGRIPTLDEAAPLEVVPGVPVFAIYRRCLVGAGFDATPTTPACVLVVAPTDRVHL